jgi:ElaB/YqjD/DUF883 family membrane-anchored ribosome-binding protein
MNSESAASSPIDEELRRLKDDYRRLLDDHAELAAMVGQIAARAGGEGAGLDQEARGHVERIQQKLDDIRGRVSAARTRGRDDLEALAGRVAHNPLASIIAAFGVGYIIARLIAGPHRS